MGLPPDVGLPEEPRRRNRQAPCIPALSERKTKPAQEPKKAPHQAGLRGFATARENQRRLGDGLPERVGDGGQTAERANHKRGGRVLEKRPLGGGSCQHHRPQTGGNPRQDWPNQGFPPLCPLRQRPEFISQALAGWAAARGVEIKFIQPGKPTQNGIIERLNGTLRKECLNLNWFYSLEEINDLLTTWHSNYNFLRPHSCLKYQTPANFEKLNQNLYFKLVP
ncbi:MAG: integrase core domain-containing protein [Spirosomataceae bacterium]